MIASTISRRSFLLNLARLSGASLLAAPIGAIARNHGERRLHFRHTHTKENLDIVYYSHGHYLAGAMLEITEFLRDYRTDESHPIDPALFDILHTISSFCPGKRCFQVISGYRSPNTNAMLRRKSSRVAKNSMHMLGKAIDVRLPDISTRTLRNLAVALQQGGVGYYRKSDFVHIDTGSIRHW